MLACSPGQEPSWEPGTAQGESALFYGHLLGQVVRAVDGRSLGRFLREEVCGPLGLDFHIGLGDAELARVADLTGFDAEFHRLPAGPPRSSTAGRSGTPRARGTPGSLNGERWRRAEIPAVNGHGTARAVAGFYVALAHGRLLEPRTAGGADARTRATSPTSSSAATGSGGWAWPSTPTATAWAASAGASAGGAQAGQYAAAFLTGHIGTHDRGDRLESAVREVLGLPPL